MRQGVSAATDKALSLDGVNQLVFFDIDATVRFAISHQAQRLALQFPDDWLPHAPTISRLLTSYASQQGFVVQCFILADTSYGCCCVDRVAAQHCQAQMIVHYGDACLGESSGVPVYYVFGRRELCVEQLAGVLRASEVSKAVVFLDLSYQHLADSLSALLEEVKGERSFSVARLHRESEKTCRPHRVGGYEFGPLSNNKGVEEEGYTLIFVGVYPQPMFSSILLNYSRSPVMVCDPSTLSLEKSPSEVSKTLARRYYLVEKAKNANRVGIIVGTLAAQKYLEVISRLKQLLRDAGKTSYLFVVGKINEPKLANFSDIDIFVVVACSIHVMINSRGFFQDIITPFEALLAFDPGREWTGTYSTNQADILEAKSSIQVNHDGDALRYSPIDGRLHQLAVTQLNQLVPVQPASSLVPHRTFTGLDPTLADPNEAPAQIQAGLEGIPRSYQRPHI
jgi:diphthamide biosynthesis protein 2